MFLLQMAGFPGSGKSTLAKEISKQVDVIVLDRDVIKSSMMEQGVVGDLVNNASYAVTFALSRFYLGMDKSVIIDTPCFYNGTLENGMAIAKEYGADYKYIECRVDDFEEITNRLRYRERAISQIESAERERFLRALDQSKKPQDTHFLVVDTSQPFEAYITSVLEYVGK